MDCRAAGRYGQPCHAAFEGGHPLFQHIIGGVHDSGVNVARHVQVEQVGAVLGVIEFEGNILIDRHCDSLGGRVRREAMVQCDGGVFHDWY